MSGAGWVKLWRRLKENGHFKMPGVAFKLWIYCLLEAAPFPDRARELQAGELWLNYEVIRQTIGEANRQMSKSTVSNALKYLSEKGYLELQTRKFYGVKARVVNWLEYQAGTETASGEGPPGVYDSPARLSETHPPGTKTVPASVPGGKPEKARPGALPGTETVPGIAPPGTPTGTETVPATVPVRAPGANGGAASGVPKNIKNKRNKEKNTYAYEPAFEEFWAEYPRKVEKQRAYRCWKIRLREGSLDGLMAEDLVRDLAIAAKNYAAACRRLGTEERYIKHPATFLGPDRPYEDWIRREPAAGTPPGPKTNQPPGDEKKREILRSLYLC